MKTWSLWGIFANQSVIFFLIISITPRTHSFNLRKLSSLFWPLWVPTCLKILLTGKLNFIAQSLKKICNFSLKWPLMSSYTNSVRLSVEANISPLNPFSGLNDVPHFFAGVDVTNVWVEMQTAQILKLQSWKYQCRKLPPLSVRKSEYQQCVLHPALYIWPETLTWNLHHRETSHKHIHESP